MDRSYDSILSMGEQRGMEASPHMSPQLNETICSCRCGCGCGCAGDGDVDESEHLSDSVTAINSDGSESSNDRSSTGCMAGTEVAGDDPDLTTIGILSPRVMSRAVTFWLLERPENLHIGEGLLSRGHIHVRPLLHEGNVGRTENPIQELGGIDFQTNATTGRGNMQTMSPGPGIGAWSQRIPEGSRVERVYILKPLRLSAES